MANVSNYAKANLGPSDFTGGTVKLLLVQADGAHTFDPDNDFVADVLATANEEGASNYSRQTLSGKSVSQDNTNDKATFDAADVSWSNAFDSANGVDGAYIYKEVTNDSDSPVFCFLPSDDTSAATIKEFAFQNGFVMEIT